MEKEKYREDAEARLRELERELARLREKADGAGPERPAVPERPEGPEEDDDRTARRKALEQGYEELRKRLCSLREGSETPWEKVREEIENIWSELKQSFTLAITGK
ncbi:MAG: hypothetical protein U0411_08565 [Thermodesulfovibrionales bacterium]